MAKEQGLSLSGPNGLLKQRTRRALEILLDEEMTEHLGDDKHGAEGSTGAANGVPERYRPNGHRLGPRHVLISSMPCWCSYPPHLGHRTYPCRRSWAIIFRPAHSDASERPDP